MYMEATYHRVLREAAHPSQRPTENVSKMPAVKNSDAYSDVRHTAGGQVASKATVIKEFQHQPTSGNNAYFAL